MLRTSLIIIRCLLVRLSLRWEWTSSIIRLALVVYVSITTT